MESAERQYKVAGIDVHKSMLAVVIADAGREGLENPTSRCAVYRIRKSNKSEGGKDAHEETHTRIAILGVSGAS